MKIRLDENVSPRVAKAILALAEGRQGFEVSHVRDVHGPKTADADWMMTFAQEGGTAIVSGDYNILRHWPDLIAYKESGLIGFFPPPAFNGWTGYAKAAFLIRWWPSILEKIERSSRGDTWRIPSRWTPDVNSFKRLDDPRFGKNGKVVPISDQRVHRNRSKSNR